MGDQSIHAEKCARVKYSPVQKYLISSHIELIKPIKTHHITRRLIL